MTFTCSRVNIQLCILLYAWCIYLTWPFNTVPKHWKLSLVHWKMWPRPLNRRDRLTKVTPIVFILWNFWDFATWLLNTMVLLNAGSTVFVLLLPMHVTLINLVCGFQATFKSSLNPTIGKWYIFTGKKYVPQSRFPQIS